MLVAFFCFSSYCLGQFTSLATTDDGSVLYFVTNLRQKGTDQPLWGKAFVADAAGLRPYLVVQMDPSTPNPPPAMTITNNYNLLFVDVSGDGDVVSRAGSSDCVNGMSLCVYREPVTTTLTGSASPTTWFPGVLHLSANAKYGLTVSSYREPLGAVEFQRIDLATGSKLGDAWTAENGVSLPLGGRMVANDGTAVLSTWYQLVLLQGTGSEILPTVPEERVSRATISSDGSLVVF